jgi:hypothetical protein
MNYYAHPYLSNSDLTALKLELMPDSVRRDYQKALDFGVLFHAMLLEPETVDHIRRAVRDLEFSQDDFLTAKRMRDAVRLDRFSQDLLKRCKTEVEMYNERTPFVMDGTPFYLDTRRKYDLWDPLVGWGGDFKSTTATTQRAFLAALTQFDYDRGRVFYAKGSGATRDVIIGVSKVNYKIFPVFMRAGCPLWTSGESKCNELAFKYKNLKVASMN